MRRVVVGFSGGVTSAWCLDWALRNFPKDEVIALFHDTKREHADTYRYLREMAAALDHPITERSDGRSVEQVEDDENALANNRMAFCSRILKVEQRVKYFDELRADGVTDILMVFGFSSHEWQRIQRFTMRAIVEGYTAVFPLKDEQVSKQMAAQWSIDLGVRLPEMYRWSDHANCVGCRRAGKGYWLAVRENEPQVFEAMKQRERDFGHTFLKDTSLELLEITGLKRPAKRREAIDFGLCECGD